MESDETVVNHIHITLAKGGTCAEHYAKIKEAIEFANLNLITRHGMKIECSHILNHGIILDVRVPKGPRDLNIGNRLRGISRYLLQHYPDEFSKLRSGKRLFYFVNFGEKTIY